jgi:hypothetical protein
VIEGKRVWTCDKCGTVVETGDGAHPAGWGELRAAFYDEGPMVPDSYFNACRSCMEAFVAKWV